MGQPGLGAELLQAPRSPCLTLFLSINGFFSFQTITEKHKLNVPETMTEVLDVSDEEGEPFPQVLGAAPSSGTELGSGCRGAASGLHSYISSFVLKNQLLPFGKGGF